jgi:hypothetical protein
VDSSGLSRNWVEIGYGRSDLVVVNEAHDGYRRCVRTRRIGKRILPPAPRLGIRYPAMEAMWDPAVVDQANGRRVLPPVPGPSYLVSKERRDERLGRIQLRCEQSSRPAGATVSEFDDLQERVFTLYAGQRFEEIHRLLDGAVERFPNRPSRITFWQACIDSLLGDPKRALERLRRGAEEGLFWPENWLETDPDLAAARALPGYEEMVEAVGRSAERANSNLRERPEVLLFAPEGDPFEAS